MLTAGMISLGCPRNLLDSEVILGSLKKAGIRIVDIEKNPDICIVNTCAFLESAREESVDAILEAAELKKKGNIKHLVICGCLSQLYNSKLADTLREADLVLGTSDFPSLPYLIKNLGKKKYTLVSRKLNYLYDEKSPRFSLTPRHYAYVKISEGCSNFCSYCIISHLRGAFRSRSIESVVSEIKGISRTKDLKEINIIGQDTTLFGIDRYGKMALAELLRRICRVRNGVKWIRVLYTHPAHYSDEFIRVVRDEGKICKYLDLPIQHISDKILKEMNRHVTKRQIAELVERLRKEMPDIALRTSVIVGFPGETDKDFAELLKFLRDTRFERLGAFIYSREEGTRAAGFGRQVPKRVKEERLDEVMSLQRDISSELNKGLLGKTVEVLIDEAVDGEKGKFIGRTYADAPEVDCSVYVSGRAVRVGEFCSVKITDTLEYDLVGEKIIS